jgi:hypothetical protein
VQVASLTKPMTAVAVVQLAEQGEQCPPSPDRRPQRGTAR